MYKGLCTILITINIAATIVISLLVCFFLGPLGYQFYYFQMLSSFNKVLPTYLPTNSNHWCTEKQRAKCTKNISILRSKSTA